jgi:sulfur relay (sulfurtransferase) complex TusBCD TusD component (DsrE family)
MSSQSQWSQWVAAVVWIRIDWLVDGARRSTLEGLMDWTIWADKVLAF